MPVSVIATSAVHLVAAEGPHWVGLSNPSREVSALQPSRNVRLGSSSWAQLLGLLGSLVCAQLLLVPDLGVRGAGVDIRAAEDEDVRLASGVGEVGRGLVVEVVASHGLGDGVGAGHGGEVGQRAVGVDGGELLLGGSVRGAVVEAAARQHAAAGDRGAELLAALAQAGGVGGPSGAGQGPVFEVDCLIEDGRLDAGALRVGDRVDLGVGAAE